MFKACIILHPLPAAFLWFCTWTHCFSLAPRARAWLFVSWYPAVCCLSGDHLHHMGGSAWPRLLAAHTPVSLLSACVVSSACVMCVWPCTVGLLAEVADALLSQHSHGQGHRSEHWNKNLPRKKSLNNLEIPCVQSPEADWHGLASLQWLKDPGQLRICWRKTRHSGEGVRHFRLDCLTPEDMAIEKYASLAVEHCKRGQVKTKMCLCLYRRGILKCFLPLAHLFPFSTMVNTE